MIWNTEFALSIIPQLLKGMALTLQATAGGTVLALILGLALAIAYRSSTVAVRKGAFGITELLRRTPLLIHLYLLFYALPEMGILLPPLAAGILALGLHTGSYMAAVYSAAIDAVPPGQWEAAKALGYNKTNLWTRIILPQAIPVMLPGLGNYALLMFKESAVLSVIAVPEAMQVALAIGNKSYRYLEAITIVGILYLVISFPAALALRALERKTAVARQ